MAVNGHADGNSSASGIEEASSVLTSCGRHSGWNAAYFIIASVFGLSLASGGWMNNLIVFLIQEFSIKSISATQIANVVFGCTQFFPLIAAIVADSFLGCFSVIWISSFIFLLGLILLLLSVTVDGLKPYHCETRSSLCSTPSQLQYGVLLSSLALVSIGLGGTRFTLATMGANQFTQLSPQASVIFFVWYFFALYFSNFISSTGIVYLEDNLSWTWGYGMCIVASSLGLAAFFAGRRYYFHNKPQGSPFMSLVHVVVASVRKRKLVISSEIADYYNGDGGDKRMVAQMSTNRLRLLNCAAIKTEEDILPNALIASPWKLCTVQQVEDLKTLIRILPLWSTSILLSTPIAIQLSLIVLQALSMDRNLGPRFRIPAGSMLVFSLISTAISLPIYDHIMWPLWKKIACKHPIPLQQIGIGHILNIASMVVSAVIESKRRATATSGSNHRHMSVLWLVPQLAIVGIGEAFHFPGQVALYYQEFPSRLKGMATAMIAMLIGIGFYLSTQVVDKQLLCFRTGFLPWKICREGM